MVISKKIASGLIGCSLFASVCSAQAATFVVNSTADTSDFNTSDGVCDTNNSAGDGPCTLRAAIQQANNDATQDTITFDAATFPQGLGTTINTVSLGITNPLTITGPGIDTVTVAGNGTNNVLEIDEAATAPAGTTFEISGLTVSGGVRGIRAGTFTVDVILDSLLIENNSGTSNGGGVLNDNSKGDTATLKIQNCVITGNSVSDTGAGVSSDDAKTEISNSFIFENFANAGGVESGGGVASTFGSKTTVSDSVIKGNGADINGGGAYVDDGSSLTVTGSLISENTTTTGKGGGVFADGKSTLSITNSGVSGNTAQTDGGGIFLNTGATLTATDSAISGNATVLGDGAGIRILNTDTVLPIVTTSATITRTSMIGNTANSDGGAFDVGGDATGDITKTVLKISNSTISDNEAMFGDGGAINVFGATTTIDGSAIDGNTADNEGGGIQNETGAKLVVTGSTISNNHCSTNDGGGIQNDGNSTIEITNSTISGNSSNINGGGINNDPNSGNKVTLLNVTLTGNIADADFSGSGEGGGIHQETGAGAFTVTNSIIAGNFSTNGSPDCGSSGTAVTSGGNNLIGTDEGCSDETFDASLNDQVGTVGSKIDPLLGSLTPADGGNPAGGGKTGVHTPQDGSPAIDGVDGTPPAPATDQHGVPRPIGAAADIGSIEVGCGDGIIGVGEACDDGGESVSCNANCTVSACGDGVINATAGETCDDSNTTGGDGCSDTCKTEACGNGVLDVGEKCEDGNTTNGDGCSSTCQSETGTSSSKDTDGDGVPDAADNCPLVANPNQADFNGNGVGDLCEPSSGGCSLIR